MSNLQILNHWKLKNLFITIVAMFGLLVVFEYVLSITGVTKRILELTNNKGPLILLVMTFQWVSMLLPMWFFSLRKSKNILKLLGFEKKESMLKSIRRAILAFLLYLFFNYILMIIIQEFNIHLPGYDPQQPHLPMFGTSSSDLIIAVIIMAIIAPVVEEVFFRGYILQTLVAKWGVKWGSVITALIFSAVHFEFQSILGLLVLSLIMNSLFLKQRSLWPSICFHIINNLVALWAEHYILTQQPINEGVFAFAF